MHRWNEDCACLCGSHWMSDYRVWRRINAVWQNHLLDLRFGSVPCRSETFDSDTAENKPQQHGNIPFPLSADISIL